MKVTTLCCTHEGLWQCWNRLDSVLIQMFCDAALLFKLVFEHARWSCSDTILETPLQKYTSSPKHLNYRPLAQVSPGLLFCGASVEILKTPTPSLTRFEKNQSITQGNLKKEMKSQQSWRLMQQNIFNSRNILAYKRYCSANT